MRSSMIISLSERCILRQSMQMDTVDEDPIWCRASRDYIAN
jgi:hypothetical protein